MNFKKNKKESLLDKNKFSVVLYTLYILYTYNAIYIQSRLQEHPCQETSTQRNKCRIEFTVNSVLYKWVDICRSY